MAVHYTDRLALDRVLDLCHEADLSVVSLQIMSAADDEDRVYTAVLALRRFGDENNDALLDEIRKDSRIFRAEVLAEKPL